MKFSPALLFVLTAKLAWIHASAAETPTRVAEEARPVDAEENRRTFVLGATLAQDEVLVIRNTRWAGRRKQVEFEEVWTGPGVVERRVEFREAAPGYWILPDSYAEQHVQRANFRIVRLTPTRLEVRLETRKSPDAAGRAGTHYRFRWEVSVERWAEVRQRHPEWPEVMPAGKGPWRALLLADGLGAGFN